MKDENERPAKARSTDPKTSHEAAKVVKVSKLEMQVLRGLEAYGSSTTVELHHSTGMPLWSLSPRMVPLEDAGFVKRLGSRESINSSGRHRKLTVWEITAAGRRKIK